MPLSKATIYLFINEVFSNWREEEIPRCEVELGQGTGSSFDWDTSELGKWLVLTHMIDVALRCLSERV